MPHSILDPPQQSVRQLLADPDTYTTVLMGIIVQQYGTAALSWTPDTIVRELVDDFAVTIPQANVDQIAVGLNLLTSDDFYMRPGSFIQICNVLCGAELTSQFDPADAAECAWGVTEAALLAPAESPEQPFHPEIMFYIGHVLDSEGIKQPPSMLQAAMRRDRLSSGHFEDLPTEDPDMFAVAYNIRADRSKEIEEYITDNFSLLLQQLSVLPGLKDAVQKMISNTRS